MKPHNVERLTRLIEINEESIKRIDEMSQQNKLEDPAHIRIYGHVSYIVKMVCEANNRLLQDIVKTEQEV